VNNESSHIIRLFNSAFNELTGNHDDYYQEPYRHEIDTLNDFIYEDINNGVYQCGFSKTQASYDQAAQRLFKALDDLDDHLSSRTYLVGEQLTEADLRLLPTLLRFDLVYVTHFKCNLKRIADYPALSRYLNRLRKLPCVIDTTYNDHIKRHYYYSHDFINPHRIIPIGPSLF